MGYMEGQRTRKKVNFRFWRIRLFSPTRRMFNPKSKIQLPKITKTHPKATIRVCFVALYFNFVHQLMCCVGKLAFSARCVGILGEEYGEITFFQFKELTVF